MLNCPCFDRLWATKNRLDWSFGHVERTDGEHDVWHSAPVAPVWRASCECYYIFRASGDHTIPFRFWLEFEEEEEEEEEGGEAVLDGRVGHPVRRPVDLAIFAQHLGATTPTIETAKDSIPEWVDAISVSSPPLRR